MGKRTNLLRPLTIGMLSIVTVLAILLRDVGFVVSVSGAGFGAALMFVVPAIMNICNLKAMAKGTELPKGQVGQNPIYTHEHTHARPYTPTHTVMSFVTE